MRTIWRKIGFQRTLKAVLCGNADRDSPYYPLAVQIIFQSKMMDRFGGRAQLLAAPIVEVQREWLLFQAEMAVQADEDRHIRSQMDSPSRRS